MCIFVVLKLQIQNKNLGCLPGMPMSTPSTACFFPGGGDVVGEALEKIMKSYFSLASSDFKCILGSQCHSATHPYLCSLCYGSYRQLVPLKACPISFGEDLQTGEASSLISSLCFLKMSHSF